MHPQRRSGRPGHVQHARIVRLFMPDEHQVDRAPIQPPAGLHALEAIIDALKRKKRFPCVTASVDLEFIALGGDA